MTSKFYKEIRPVAGGRQSFLNKPREILLCNLGFCSKTNQTHPGEPSRPSQLTRNGVQVNLVASACYSGYLVNAIDVDNRKFRYVQVPAAADKFIRIR